MIGFAYYLEGDFERARSVCEKSPEEEGLGWGCLAITYDKLGRHADAEAVLAHARAKYGDIKATGYAMVYAQWGNTARALDCLERANRMRDPDLIQLKQQELFDLLRKEPRFQAVMRELKFP
jgi:tetratricopeptide (TPR) repeat protein